MKPARLIATWLVSLSLALAPAAFAAEDAFRFVVFDTGEQLEFDWAIDDGAYVVRESVSVSSTQQGFSLGEQQVEPGVIEDGTAVFRGNFFMSIPYSIDGERPDSVVIRVEGRGGDDDGTTYEALEWIETVELEKPSTKPKLDLGALGGSGSSMDDFPPPDEVFFPDLFVVDGNTIEVGFRIIPEFYLYKNKITATVLNENARAGNLELPKGKLKTDEFFGEQEVYYNEMVGKLTIQRATPEAMELEIELGYQGCADAGLCYLPQKKVLTVSLPEASTISKLSDVSGAPVSEQSRLARIILEESIWVVAGVFFLAGLGLAFTPCVLPMVPILSGIIAGEGDDVSPMRGFTLALSYVMGMALVYTAAGVGAAAAGMQLQAFFNQPWILTLFASLFVLLALGMFGMYDLQMPSGIQSKLANVSGDQKSGTMVGAFVMGALSALVVTACVAPALIAALTVMAQTGDMLRGGSALFAMSMGMGAPLLLVGAAQGQLLPKAGPWMVAIKGAFGFMMLGLAIWMLSRVLPGVATMASWATLIFMAGIFMGGLTQLTQESGVAQKLGKGFGLLAILYGITLFAGALTGGTNPLKPLATVNFGGGAGVEEDRHLKFTLVKTVEDFEREVAAANAAGKSVMLDFYADWCISCIEMEEYTFITDEVQAALANTVTLQADVTKADDEDRRLLGEFGSFGPPTIVFIRADGTRNSEYDIVGFVPAAEFAAHVSQAISIPSTDST